MKCPECSGLQCKIIAEYPEKSLRYWMCLLCSHLFWKTIVWSKEKRGIPVVEANQ
jgi:hypothetical protein